MNTKKESSLSLILSLALVAMMSGLLVVLTFQLTLPRIEQNKQAALEKAIFEVLPAATSRLNFRLTDKGMEEIPDNRAAQANLFAGYDSSGRLTGFAMEGAARGYQDVVKVLYGYNPQSGCIIGFTVLQSTETPGLGDKVETDPDFLANFDCLKAKLNEAGTALAHDIVTVKNGKKTKPWQIDGISGATVTSAAVGKAIGDSSNALLPLVLQYRDKIPEQIDP